MNDEGFERAVHDHTRRVHSHAVWILRDPEEARDVAQEALLTLWRHRDTVAEAAAGSWLVRTTYRLCIDRLRSRAVRAEAARTAQGEQDPSEPGGADPAPGPERLAASARLGERLEHALRNLSARDRALVLLREVEGFSYEELAGMLGLPLGTLKAALHRSREKLREALSRDGVRP